MPCTLVPEFQDTCGDATPLKSGIKPDDGKFSLIALQRCDVVRKNPPASQNEGDFCIDWGEKTQTPPLDDISALAVSRTVVVCHVIDHVIVEV